MLAHTSLTHALKILTQTRGGLSKDLMVSAMSWLYKSGWGRFGVGKRYSIRAKDCWKCWFYSLRWSRNGRGLQTFQNNVFEKLTPKDKIIIASIFCMWSTNIAVTIKLIHFQTEDTNNRQSSWRPNWIENWFKDSKRYSWNDAASRIDRLSFLKKIKWDKIKAKLIECL